jgi:hypothetical protein
MRSQWLLVFSALWWKHVKCLTVLPTSHRGGLGSRPGSTWNLWWTKRHWGRYSPSTSVSPANHSTNFSIIIITRGVHNRTTSGRSAEYTQLDSTPHYIN